MKQAKDTYYSRCMEFERVKKETTNAKDIEKVGTVEYKKKEINHYSQNHVSSDMFQCSAKSKIVVSSILI